MLGHPKQPSIFNDLVTVLNYKQVLFLKKKYVYGKTDATETLNSRQTRLINSPESVSYSPSETLYKVDDSL